VKFVYVFLLIGSLQGINAGTVGDPLITRQTTDTTPGLLFAYDGTFGAVGNVLTWSFYAGSNNPSLQNIAGQQITPVILDQSTPGGWSVTGIGTTQTVSGSGLYTFNFGLVSGSAAVGPNLTFGWYDGSSTASNPGTISFDLATTAVGFSDFVSLAFPVLNTAYATQNDFTGANDGTSWTGGRIYSVQFVSSESDIPTDPPADAPEPSSLAMMLAGAFTLIALKSRR
jgi:hypothetical protein